MGRTNVNRRDFIGRGALAIAGIVVAGGLPGRSAGPHPVLYGDGVHDDTVALESWMNGQPVIHPNGNPVDPHNLVGGTYDISRPVSVVSAGPTATLRDVTIRAGNGEWLSGGMIYLRNTVRA